VAADPKNTLIESLVRREHSWAELDRKLRNKHPELSLIERLSLLNWLITERLQSDERFSEALVRSRLNRGWGLRRIELELQTHGIDSSRIDDWLGCDVASEQDRATEVLRKWLRSKKDPARDKALRFLASRGFSFSDATEAVDSIMG
jgi:regulatory protein